MEEENTQLCICCLKSYPEGSEGFWRSYLVQSPYDPEDISEEHDWTCKECAEEQDAYWYAVYLEELYRGQEDLPF